MTAKKTAPQEPLLEMDFNHVMAENLPPDIGLTWSEIEALGPALKQAHQSLMQSRQDGLLPFYDLPFQTRELRAVRRAADEIRRTAENLVVFGIGGSALGTTALFQALAPQGHNLLDRTQRRFPRLFVADNVDPESIAALLDFVDPRRTVFNIISKSGATTETMSQFMIVYDRLRKSLGRSSVREHLILTTDPEKGFLRALADREGYTVLDVPPQVGGRYSVLTAVGLLPLAAVGINVSELLRGAAAAAETCTRANFKQNPAYLFAALAYALNTRRGRSILVMMPYSSALSGLADWFCQLWAESLGKLKSTDGRVVRAGQTPVRAVGATDQHSQLQLYMEGPQDKAIVFLKPKTYRSDLRIPPVFKEYDQVNYLGGHSLGELMDMEQASTAKAVARAGQPNLTLTLPRIMPATMGYLLYMLETATVASGHLYQVNALDQPGVELSKNYAYGLMGRPGYKNYMDEFKAGPRSKKKYIL